METRASRSVTAQRDTVVIDCCIVNYMLPIVQMASPTTLPILAVAVLCADPP